MFTVDIHTDGSCLGNPGVGGYCSILNYKGRERVVCGYCTDTTTNNRMELTAVIEGLKALKKPCYVTVYTDSQYICNNSAHDHLWLAGRANSDLWLELITAEFKGQHKIKFVKVPAHAGEELNERCDRIAKQQCQIAKLVKGA